MADDKVKQKTEKRVVTDTEYQVSVCLALHNHNLLTYILPGSHLTTFYTINRHGAEIKFKEFQYTRGLYNMNETFIKNMSLFVFKFM